MAEETTIAWCHSTWNPWRGCQHAMLPDGSPHPGCLNCYAEKFSKRNPKTLGTWGAEGTRVMGVPDYWKHPYKWNDAAQKAGERRRVFCASYADVFENWHGVILDTDECRMVVNASGARFHVTPDWEPCYGERLLTLDDLRREVFRTIDETPNLDYLLLTKRPQNIRRMWPSADVFDTESAHKAYWPNVWLLTSISHQASADAMVPPLLECRGLAPVLGLSIEPLLGPIDLTHCWLQDCTGFWNALDGRLTVKVIADSGPDFWAETQDPIGQKLGWVIIGCESDGHRVGSLGEFQSEADWWEFTECFVDQCENACVPVFMKQVPIGGKVSHDPNQWPEWARVREFPEVAHA